jgi:hypothetical protein
VPTSNPVVAVEQGPSGQGGAAVIESPPLVQGQSVIFCSQFGMRRFPGRFEP